MPEVARVTDTGSHGGTIVTGAAYTRSEGLKVARVGDTYACPIHGPNPIVAGSSNCRIEGAALARVGDPTSCGATITSGSPNWTDNG